MTAYPTVPSDMLLPLGSEMESPTQLRERARRLRESAELDETALRQHVIAVQLGSMHAETRALSRAMELDIPKKKDAIRRAREEADGLDAAAKAKEDASAAEAERNAEAGRTAEAKRQARAKEHPEWPSDRDIERFKHEVREQLRKGNVYDPPSWVDHSTDA